MAQQPSLRSLRASIQRLPIAQQRSLLTWLQHELSENAAPDYAALRKTESRTQRLREPLHSETTESEMGPEIVQRQNVAIAARRHYEGKLYQYEKRRCGKAECRCMEGNLAEVGHGPYWYAYWKEQGKLRNRYIGKRPPWDPSKL